jgi:threonine aldolase
VDILSFGGMKNGVAFGEAVVVLKPGLAARAPYLRKTRLQLASKMRFISAQLEALLEADLWMENGRHANEVAQALLRAVAPLPDVSVAFPVETSAVFARVDPARIARLQRASFFWPWDEHAGLVRWMCSWDSDPADVERFAGVLAESGPAAGR